MESEREAIEKLIELVKKLEKDLDKVAYVVLSTDVNPNVRAQYRNELASALDIVRRQLKDQLRIIIKDEALIKKLIG